MDPGFYRDLTGRLYSLLIVLEDSLNFDDAPLIYQFTDASHDALAMEEIVRAAAHRQIGITVREHAGVLTLAGVLARADQAPPAGEFVQELTADG